MDFIAEDMGGVETFRLQEATHICYGCVVSATSCPSATLDLYPHAVLDNDKHGLQLCGSSGFRGGR